MSQPTLSEKMQQRLDGQRQWLLESDPFCFTEQKHLNEGSVERIYWHYGYQTALSDLLEDVKELEGIIAGLNDVREGRVKSLDQIHAELESGADPAESK